VSISGSTLFARIAMNPDCALQAAMGLDRQQRTERDFYQALVGEPFRGEYGERVSARRRGSKFEKNLLSPPGDARLLREAVGPILGIDPKDVTVRDLETEQPGGAEACRVNRVKLTRALLSTAHAGLPTMVIVKPTLILNTGFSPRDLHWRYIEPDFIVWSPMLQVYVPGDFKSFVVRDGVVESAKLERVRLQLACDVVALRDELRRLRRGLEQRLPPNGYLVFATPYGLKPDTPKLEDLSGAVPMMLKAISAFKNHRNRIVAAAAGAPIVTTAPDLRVNYQEKCIATCILATHCRARLGDHPSLLGDAARDLLGDSIPLQRLAALATGAEPRGQDEARIAPDLRAALS
jgi:hypothetical protein